CPMALQIPAAKQSAVNLWVKSLHAPVEDLGKARMLGDVNYRQSDVPQHLRRTARRENLDAAGSQCPAKVIQASFVADRNERTLNGDQAFSGHPLLPRPIARSAQGAICFSGSS